MVTVGMKVAMAREAQNPIWSQRYLAQVTGVSRPKIAQWENGKTKQPRREDIEVIARALEIPLEWFFDGQEGPPPRPNAEAPAQIAHDPELIKGFAVTVAVQTYRSALAAFDIDEEQFFEESDLPQEIPSGFLIGGIRNLNRHAVIVIAGRSMSPVIEPNDRVLFYRDDTPRSNTVVMVESPGGKVYVKALRDRRGHWELESLNEGHLAVSDLKGWKLHGYAVAIMRDPEGPQPNIHWPFGQPVKV